MRNVMKSLENTRHVSRDKLAEVLGVQPCIVNKLRMNGRIPFLRLNPRLYRYNLEAVLAKLKEGSVDDSDE
jgi:hypothetical protein